MTMENDRKFGRLITRLTQKENLTREESKAAFRTILANETTAMQQGAFLAALTAKGETADEVAGSWEAIYDLDTVKTTPNTAKPIVENSGTGMDSFKTFNISTAASLVAASDSIAMARHGARAITSKCGTVDMAEALGVDVECSADMVTKSIEQSGIGLYNGMSPEIHPMALGRILADIHFGSTLNIAASLANPALPQIGIRGVYAKERIIAVIEVMKAIGYRRALVFYGGIDGSTNGMDEASVCGTTHCAELKQDGEIREFSFVPKDFGLATGLPDELSPVGDLQTETKAFIALIQGKTNGVRAEAVILNAALIFYGADKVTSIEAGVNKAAAILKDGAAYETLQKWITAQNRDPEAGLNKLASCMN